MKMKKLIVIAAAHLLLLSPIAKADVFMQLPFGVTCDDLAGKWGGSGSITFKGIDCTYTGNADVTGSSSFNMHIVLNKSTGSIFCPKSEDLRLDGTCINGALVVHNNDADLTGNLYQDTKGIGASAKGYVYFDLFGKRQQATVNSMDLRKQSPIN